MQKKSISIPVNIMANEPGQGIVIEQMSLDDLQPHEMEAAKEIHRHDRHSFFLLESGTVAIEIDFQKYKITPASIIYIHPNQVHRTAVLKNVKVISWAINNENLNPEYKKLLEEITPAKPLKLKKETFAVIYEMVSLCLKFTERKNDKLYHALLKDSCNALVALVISQYLEHTKSSDKYSRAEIITKDFNTALEHHFVTLKKPNEYAALLHISTAYLNECIKNTTGYPVSHHIQQRIILEAKRLLFYSDKSVKEIATQLGYDDYPYFSRLFTKVTGMTALAFRNKNHD